MAKTDKIGLGSVQFGMKYGIANKSGKTPENEVAKILDYARDRGIEYIDTASAYGEAEKVLGNNDLMGFKVISKFMPPRLEESVEAQFDKSLKRLKRDSIYGYLAHRPKSLLTDRRQWNTLLHLKKEARVTKIGYSLNHPKELESLLSEGLWPDLVQVPYNYFDQRFMDQMIGLKERGCEIHTRSTFLQGLFFMDPEILPSHFDPVKPYIEKLQKDHGHNLSGVLLNFVLDREFVDRVIVGIESLSQLKKNIKNCKKADSIRAGNHRIHDEILTPSFWPET